MSEKRGEVCDWEDAGLSFCAPRALGGDGEGLAAEDGGGEGELIDDDDGEGVFSGGEFGDGDAVAEVAGTEDGVEVGAGDVGDDLGAEEAIDVEADPRGAAGECGGDRPAIGGGG